MWESTIRSEATASKVEAIASMLEAITIGVQAIAIRVEAIAIRVGAIAIRFRLLCHTPHQSGRASHKAHLAQVGQPMSASQTDCQCLNNTEVVSR